MVIELNGNLLLWYIAIIMTVQVILFYAILTALRFGLAHGLPLIPKINRLIVKYGGGDKGEKAEGGGGGGLGDVLGPLIGKIFGGEK